MVEAIATLLFAAPVGLAWVLYDNHQFGVRLCTRAAVLSLVAVAFGFTYTYGKLDGAEHVLTSLKPGIEELSERVDALETRAKSLGLELESEPGMRVVEAFRDSEDDFAEIGFPMQIIGALVLLLACSLVLPFVIPSREPDQNPKGQAKDDEAH